ncbi:putative acyltransferase YihG [Pseudoalteromonas holothuriae]|uniref:Acyltransferase YihG n=1 Tax=Pseudoalteromonas holothuriae TaxID=2963714 RepID=A0A9W4R2Z4_9GAMM|nr:MULTISPECIES: acetyltransferase [unclassified Pseudoalteromonas]CAH9064475.1 putative acyltransferase YihG [Pseudoalteromonas sp. CIP111854]CAH9065430.1 putative acyltransferase YihG [Pseudoalteromonas sp. CIP111951]
MHRKVLPNWFFGFCATLLLLFNTVVSGSIVFFLGLVKLFLPIRAISILLHLAYDMWCKGNRLGLYVGCEQVNINVSETVKQQGWYLLVSNHISWLDIVVLSAAEALPAPKFFLKDELKYIPFIGTGAWAMGMPFMKRASKSQVAKNPKLKGLDVERTQHSCRNFRQHPTTVINFAEGTRFTQTKQKQQGGGYNHLLKPKAGGTAFALEVLAQQLDGLLNCTLMYQAKSQHICGSFMLGQLQSVNVEVELLAIAQVPQGSYQGDNSYRTHFQNYLNQLWQNKDEQITQYMVERSDMSSHTNKKVASL